MRKSVKTISWFSHGRSRCGRRAYVFETFDSQIFADRNYHAMLHPQGIIENPQQSACSALPSTVHILHSKECNANSSSRDLERYSQQSCRLGAPRVNLHTLEQDTQLKLVAALSL